MGSKNLCHCKEEKACYCFCGHFTGSGSTGSLAIKLTGLLGIWFQTAGCTHLCMIQSNALAWCYFTTPHCFSGELIAPSKAGVTLAGVPVTLRL